MLTSDERKKRVRRIMIMLLPIFGALTLLAVVVLVVFN